MRVGNEQRRRAQESEGIMRRCSLGIFCGARVGGEDAMSISPSNFWQCLEGLGISTEDTNSISYWSGLLIFSPAKTPGVLHCPAGHLLAVNISST
jgi:hypothetical protein